MLRRTFLKNSGVAGAIAAGTLGVETLGIAALGEKAPAKVPAKPPAIVKDRRANSKIAVAVIGLRGIGKSHLSAYLRQSNDVAVTALCDCDSEYLDAAAEALEAKGVSPRPKLYRDLREVFADRDVDAVSICTPNYWHALATVWACQAGKHVCVEKPVSHCIWEGRKMVEAARKYDRLVQADIDSRSNTGLAAAIAYARQNLGAPRWVRITGYKRRKSIGITRGPGKIPETCDYNLHSGPLPLMPLPRRELHYDWHWQWLSGNGELGNNGPHQLDMCRRILGSNAAPRRAISFGGRLGYLDDGNVPNTQLAWFDIGGVPVVFEARALGRVAGDDVMDDLRATTATGKPIRAVCGSTTNCNICAVFENGYLLGQAIYDNNGALVQDFPGRSAPQRAFINALKTGKRDDLCCDILDGHLSANISHIGNISYQCGHRASLAEVRAAAGNFPHLAETFADTERHLAANGVEPEKAALFLGPELRYDAAGEHFTGAHAERANLFLRDTQRPPFAITGI
jgi:predicted dehydrogenase